MFRGQILRARLAKLSARGKIELTPRSLRAALANWTRSHHAIITNASALIATTTVTSGLGFVYWWLAARLYPASEVGFAAAAVSAMSLLGTFAMLGFGTLLMGEIQRQPGKERSLIATALTVTGLVGGVLGVVLALAAPSLSPDLRPLGDSATGVTLFGLGVSLTAMTLVLDQALIGMLRGGLQLGRNILFAGVKLVALAAAGVWLPGRVGLALYATWVLGIVVSLVVLMRLGGRASAWLPSRELLRGQGRVTLGHHALNLALLAPGMLLPVLVTVLLSAALNAGFYAAWMMANLVYIGPAALSMVLYAVSASDTALLAQKTRFTLRLAFLGGVAAVVMLQFLAAPMLGVFGQSYAAQAASSLSILGFGVFPLIVKDHYVAICRVRGRIVPAALLIGGLGVFELIAAAVGARLAGLPGLSIGWVAAMVVGAAPMGRTVYAAVMNKDTTAIRNSGELGR